MKILQVVGKMDAGGSETWLLNVARRIKREECQMDFLVHTTDPGVYDAELRSLGANIIPCLNVSKPWKYAANLQRVLREHGPYDVVHSHVYHFSGLVLKTAKKAGVPVRVAHSHTSKPQSSLSIFRKAYAALSIGWINESATHILAASAKAASSLYRGNFGSDPRCHVLHCGMDTAPFHKAVDKKSLRAVLNIPKDALVIGHVGRFVAVKNHAFMLSVLKEMLEINPKIYLILLGNGPLQSEIESQARDMALQEHVVFAGVRPNVADFMLEALDMFIFPSLYEGLGLAMVEAQAAGLKCFVSDTVPTEADVVKPLVHRLSLSSPASDWAKAMLSQASDCPISKQEALALVESSSFNIEQGVAALEDLYRSACNATAGNVR